jgi:hypothetical protein
VLYETAERRVKRTKEGIRERKENNGIIKEGNGKRIKIFYIKFGLLFILNSFTHYYPSTLQSASFKTYC